MGKLMKNGIDYSGGGGDAGIEITQAEYDLLTPEQQATGMYYITDAPSAQVNIDTALSTTSTNPVQNKVITNAINTINANLTYKEAGHVDSIAQDVASVITLSYSALFNAKEVKACMHIYGTNSLWEMRPGMVLTASSTTATAFLYGMFQDSSGNAKIGRLTLYWSDLTNAPSSCAVSYQTTDGSSFHFSNSAFAYRIDFLYR